VYLALAANSLASLNSWDVFSHSNSCRSYGHGLGHGLRISGTNPRIWRLLAAAYAENGRFPDAVDAARTGLRFAAAAGDSALVHTLEMNIALFQANSPLRDIGHAIVTPK
jgi:cytochrome c-type biogenesis protein CcmH/NrfG